MALFHYHYIDSEGKKKKGMIDATHHNEAKEKLRGLGLLVTHLEKVIKKKSRFWGKQKDQLRGDSLVTFTTQLAQLLTAGLPLYECLVSLEEQYRREKFHLIILSLGDQIKEGASLSHAMRHFPASFNDLYCAMVVAGESVGLIDKTLEKLAQLLRRQNSLKKQLVTSLIYPGVLFSFSLVVITLLLTFVIPSLEGLFEDREVNRFTKLVMSMSHFVSRFWFLIVSLPLAIGLFTLYSSKTKLWIRKKFLHIPVLKTLIIQVALGRFSRTVATLLQGGVPLTEALKIGRKVMRNPFLEEIIEKAEQRIVEGSLLSKELKKSPLIPKLIPRMLSIGEEGGSIMTMLHKIADIYEEDVEKILSRLTALAQPVILLVMGGIVGLVMLAVLLPLTDVSAFM